MNNRSRTPTTLAIAALVATSACGEFEVPSIVLDLRVLAIQAEPPEVVIPLGIEELEQEIDDPSALIEVLEQLPDVQVCALVADPADARSLEFTMNACAPTEELRCDQPDKTVISIGSGTAMDPEDSTVPVSICGTLTPSFDLLSVLGESFEDDSLSGFSGLVVQIEFSVRPAGTPIENAQYGAKRVVYSLDFPRGKQANQNPGLMALARETPDGGEEPLTQGRCGDIVPHVVGPSNGVVIVPQEAPEARELYVVPTFDGGERSFTENLTYRWYATAGKLGPETTGGPKDVAGNEPPLDTEWTAPASIDGSALVNLWVVQRDERGGLSWYETCVRVE